MTRKEILTFLFFFCLINLAYASEITITAEVDSQKIIYESDESNNIKGVTTTVVPTQQINLLFVPIDFNPTANDSNIFISACKKQAEYFSAVYPVSKDKLRAAVSTGIYSSNLNISLFDTFLSIKTLFGPVSKKIFGKQKFSYIIGIVPENWFRNRFNANMVGVKAGFIGGIVLVEPNYPVVTAHEIGHEFGLCDEYNNYCGRVACFGDIGVPTPGCTFCPNSYGQNCPAAGSCFNGQQSATCNGEPGVKGFWVIDENKEIGKEIGNGYTWYSFMGTAGSLDDRWASKTVYNHLLSSLKSGVSLSSGLQNRGKLNEIILLESPQNFLVVSGLVNKSNSVELKNFYLIDEGVEEEIQPGDYSLKLLDANNNVLFDQNFGVSFTMLSDPPIDLNTTGFAFVLPFPEGTHKIRIDFNGLTRAERLVSANAPTTSIVSPAGGEEWSSEHLVQWNASDVDGDKLSFVLQYSADDGVTWNPIAIDLNEESYELNAGYLPPADDYKLKVIATDGVLTGEAVSNTFIVRNPDIDVQPWRLEFGEVEQGTIVSQDISLANTGNADLQVYNFNAPENVSIPGISLPLTLLPEQSIQFNIGLNTVALEGSVNKEVVFYSNDPNEPEKHFFIEGSVFVPETMDGNLHLADMNSYLKEQGHYSGAASAQMILNYIREAAGLTLLSQDKIYSYGHKYNLSDNNELLELDTNAMVTVLGHFDPYDFIISEPYDRFDSLADGNPYQGYSFSIDTFDANDSNAVTKYMKDIAHWMAYPVTRKAWWLDSELVAKPNTPAAIPLYGNYSNWAVVNGFAASGNPVPNPKTNPWQSNPVTIYGFWLTDPATNGIGQHVFVTAADANAIYFKPMDSNDAFKGKYLQIAEPPALPPEEIMQNIDFESDAKVEIAEPVADKANLSFVGVEEKKETPKRKAISVGTLIVTATGSGETPVKEKNNWRDLVDSHLLLDQEAIAAFENAEMSEPLLVQELDKGQNYYLVPFNKQGLTTGVIMLDAHQGYFKQAAWTTEPEQYPAVGEQNAVSLVKREINPKPTESLAVEFNSFEEASAQLAWQPNNYSQSPFKPYWVIEMDGGKWIATQEGKLYEILPTTSNKADTQVIESAAVPPESNGFTSLGKYFEIINPNIENGSFSATLTFFYNDADNDGIVDGTNIEEQKLNVYYFEEGKGWTEIAEPERNTEANTISATVNHFSLFALMATEQQPAADSNPNTVPQSGSSGSSGGSTISPQKNAVEGVENTPNAPTKDIEENKELTKKPVEEKKTAIEAEEKNAAKEASKHELQATPTGLIVLGSDKAIAILLGCFLIAIVLSAKMYLSKKKKSS
jgi:hypothetical protein